MQQLIVMAKVRKDIQKVRLRQAESEEGSLNLSPKQMTEYGVKLAQVGVGEVGQQFAYPAKLVTNTDQQAHVSATFAGRVESVNAVLDQQVKKGQVLATSIYPWSGRSAG